MTCLNINTLDTTGNQSIGITTVNIPNSTQTLDTNTVTIPISYTSGLIDNEDFPRYYEGTGI